MATKSFDCVAMMHEGAAVVREQTKGMTAEQQVAYWRERTETLRKRQRAQSGKQTPVSTAATR